MKKLLSKILDSFISFACVICFMTPMVYAYADEDTVKMWRLYNPNSGEHFYTSSIAERDNVYDAGWNIEGYGWISPTTSNTPVYRMYNPNAGDHHYTSSIAERDYLVSVGWQYERIAWYATDDSEGIPIYREYNPNAVTGSHNFTTSKAEHNHLVSVGWKDEGIAFYVSGMGGSDGSREHWYGYSDEKMLEAHRAIGSQWDYKYADSSIMCSAYCISYARAAMFGDTREPSTYWSSTGGAVWSWGGGIDHRGVTDVLAMARQQINEGKVSIIHLQGHYVVVYAYKGIGANLSDYKVLDTNKEYQYWDGYTCLKYLSEYKLAGDGQIITF